jgi:glycosyltransferase involved in cell wall biosynthesis
MDKKLISIVVPAYNEGKNIILFYKEVFFVLNKLKDKYNFELIFVDDGSTDNSWEEISYLIQNDDVVK